MRKQQDQMPTQETTSGAASSNGAVGSQRPQNLFPEQPSNTSNIMDIDKVASEIKQENGSVPGKGSDDVVNPALTSPPPMARMFLGMKRHTPQFHPGNFHQKKESQYSCMQKCRKSCCQSVSTNIFCCRVHCKGG